MTPLQRRREILQEINTITRMERGKLCTQSPGPGAAPFHKLQCWHQGKNHTRYVPADEVPALPIRVNLSRSEAELNESEWGARASSPLHPASCRMR